ncbi:uncharacterized protein PFL1_04165 [Pseudozyma flocculosa PF-1]|uniref:Related to VAC14 - protein involved in regulated synthesis of PtdIns(3,5)P(2) n=2 Tax=Pseudozyma flocculosa TaxID=84751 RepID=A0A5C3EWH0_9BASI|nr:uncharacterized protein PFL1_04165 [Pseudozyma flocculosa PF-1]EPQ28338.1 hypothetical protein PFL1_04165 [Pseudozyma flocculosa PF-1]SPO35489.1 related to VAC14 - protein involved in regulated synthesis of PtdIns(3,5)P(2) [Pseudozyma flocculosa]
MDAALQKALLNSVYDKRKAATLDLERQVRDCLARGDRARVNLIVQQLCSLLTASPQNVNARNGGLIGLAGIGIALGVEIAPYLEQIAKPVLECFADPDSKIRYFACESFYNIAKVCKGEILVYFNEIFDSLSKLAADSELSVKNGAELLDRLLKDVVCEAAPHYASQYQDIALIRSRQDAASGISGGTAQLDVAREKAHGLIADAEGTAANKVFSLARFVPLLADRIYVLSPFTRNYLVSWITVLDSVPDLELVSYLPAFLDGLLKYLSDPNTDVRVATANVLADFLREIREAAEVNALRAEAEKRRAERAAKTRRQAEERKATASADTGTTSASQAPDQDAPQGQQTEAVATSGDGLGTEAAGACGEGEGSVIDKDDDELEEEDIWVHGHEIRIDYAAIMDILINHISYPDEEIQATTLQWIAELLLVVKDVVVPFTPRLIPAILPSLAHHSPAIAAAANATNANLVSVIQQLPAPPVPPPQIVRPPSSNSGDVRERIGKDRAANSSPTTTTAGKAADKSIVPSASTPASHTDTVARRQAPSSQGAAGPSNLRDAFSPPISPRSRAATLSSEHDSIAASLANARIEEGAGTATQLEAPASKSRSRSPTVVDRDPFDYQTTVNALTLQLLDEHEETRVTALEWLLMLHQKCPRKILSMDDGTFPALLKTLSDPSDEVIRCDLRLLAQISSASEDSYFHAFMANLLSLFSTDRRLLETRGSLIIRQLCASLHTERIFRTLAEILEKDEDLEFASIMVQNLNVILITSPELADFRKRLRNLDSRDGQTLFASIYRSWCHNAVAAFSLCLLAQAYEHASNLLGIFAEQLEITVSLLIQIDKLVQLLESPIFTALRLQLLEPEKHPYLFKCLYGLLMLLPQSSAFVTLRNRLNAVNGLGFLHSVPRSSYAQTIRGPGKTASRDEIKWAELLTHFKVTQARHERARRAGLAGAGGGGIGDSNTHMIGQLNSALSSAGGGGGGAAPLRTGGGTVGGRRRASQTVQGSLSGGSSANGGARSGSTAGPSPFNPVGPGARSAVAGRYPGSGDATASGSGVPASTSSPSFFGMHLSGSAGNAGNARSTSPSSTRRAVGGPGASSLGGARTVSRGSGYR